MTFVLGRCLNEKREKRIETRWNCELQSEFLCWIQNYCPLCLCGSSGWITHKHQVHYSEASWSLSWPWWQTHLCFMNESVCSHTRGSLLLIVNEDWCLEVVTLYTVSWWNPCILISSVLCSVRHTVPIAPGFPWPPQWWLLWWLTGFSWSTAALRDRLLGRFLYIAHYAGHTQRTVWLKEMFLILGNVFFTY